jgi:Golgi phosphoprotein 3 (GPP34)
VVTLAEDLFLLACHDATGRARIPTANLDLGLGGALLLELMQHGRLALVNDRVAVVDRTAVGDPLLDAALHTVAAGAKSHEPDYWVRRLAKGTRAAVRDRLVAVGVLLIEDHKVLGVIPVHHTHQINGRIEHELVRRLHDAVVLGHLASPETAAVVSLALAVGLEQHLFPRSDRRAIRRRMQQIADGEPVGAAVRHTIDAVNAALGTGTGFEAEPEPET